MGKITTKNPEVHYFVFHLNDDAQDGFFEGRGACRPVEKNKVIANYFKPLFQKMVRALNALGYEVANSQTTCYGAVSGDDCSPQILVGGGLTDVSDLVLESGLFYREVDRYSTDRRASEQSLLRRTARTIEYRRVDGNVYNVYLLRHYNSSSGTVLDEHERLCLTPKQVGEVVRRLDRVRRQLENKGFELLDGHKKENGLPKSLLVIGNEEPPPILDDDELIPVSELHKKDIPYKPFDYFFSSTVQQVRIIQGLSVAR